MTAGGQEPAPQAADLAELAEIAAAVAGAAPCAAVPFAAPLLLFARLGADERAAVFAPRPGRMLVQDSLSLEAVDRLMPGETLAVRRADPVAGRVDGPFLFDVALTRTGGAAIATVKAGLSLLPSEAVVRAEGLAPPRARPGETVHRLEIVPIGQEVVDRWLRLVGDDNPVHGLAFRDVVPELAAPIVPGALLAAAAEAIVGRVAPGRPLRMTARFAATIAIGEAVSVEVVERAAPEGAASRPIRLQFARANGRIAALIDLTIGCAAPIRG